jgi:hypothetical protein
MPDASGVRAGRAFVELGASDAPLVKGLDAAKRKLVSWSQGLNALGASLALSGALRIGAAFSAVLNSASSGDALYRLSQRTSESVENLSALGHVARVAGGNLSDVETAATSLESALIGAIRNGGDVALVLTRMGLQARNLQGLPLAEQLHQIADGMTRLSGDAMRAEASQMLFSGASNTMRVAMSRGAAGMLEVEDAARRMNVTMGTQEAEAAHTFQLSMTMVKESLSRVIDVIGANFLPTFARIVDGIRAVLPDVITFIKRNKELALALLAGAAADVALGAAMYLLSGAVSVLSFGLLVLKGIVVGLHALFLPVSLTAGLVALKFLLIGAAIGGLVYLVLRLSGAWDWLSEAITKDLGSTFQDLTQAFETVKLAIGGVIDALKAGDLALAGKVAMTGLKLAFLQATVTMRDDWNNFTSDFMSAWSTATTFVAHRLLDLVQTFRSAQREVQTLPRNMWDEVRAIGEEVIDPTGFTRSTLQGFGLGSNWQQAARARDASEGQQHEQGQNRQHQMIDEDEARAQGRLWRPSRSPFLSSLGFGSNPEIQRLRGELAALVAQAADQKKKADEAIAQRMEPTATGARGPVDQYHQLTAGTFSGLQAAATGGSTGELATIVTNTGNMARRLASIENRLNNMQFGWGQ